MSDNVLVTGRPGSGKTTLVVRLVERFAERGFKTAGFVSEEIREGRNRIGFQVRDLGGDAGILAHVAHKGEQRVGKYGVDVASFEKIALRALERGTGADVLVIDEIGRMELFSAAFRSTLNDLLDAPLPLLATAHRSGKNGYMADIQGRCLGVRARSREP